jgi:4-hydroxy-tetrahydrodipicolinate synthase
MRDRSGAPVLFAASLTPLRPDGAIDHELLARHARALVARGCEGVALFGTTGEGQAFSVEERMAGLEALLAGGFPAGRVILGAGASALPDVVRLASHATGLGCARVLLLPYFLFRDAREEGIFRFHAEVVEGVGDQRLRLLLYNLPSISGIVLAPRLIERLAAAFPGAIAGIKDSSADWRWTSSLLRRFPGLPVYVGAEPYLRRAVAAGAAGGICGLANLSPELLLRLLTAGDRATQAMVERLVELVLGHPVVPASKALQAEADREPGWHRVRAPLLPLERAARERLLAGWAQLETAARRVA